MTVPYNMIRYWLWLHELYGLHYFHGHSLKHARSLAHSGCFHLPITSWHLFPFSHSLLAPFCAFGLMSYVVKSFLMEKSYLLPHVKLRPVTFFLKRWYLLPRKNFKLPYLPSQVHLDPSVCTRLKSSHIHSIHKQNQAISSTGTRHVCYLFVPFDPAAAGRGRR